MEICRLMRCFMTLAVITWSGGTKATNLLNIKDTLTVLPEHLSRLSLLHGAAAWHSGTIMNMYDHGVPESSTESPIIKNVVRKLFYRVPGTTSSADFKVTKVAQDAFSKNKEGYIKKATEPLVKLLYRKIIEPEISKEKQQQLRLERWRLYNQYFKKVLSLPSEKTDDVFFGLSQDQIQAEIVIRLAHLWALIGHDRGLIKKYYEELKAAFNALNKNVIASLKPIFKKNEALTNLTCLVLWDGDIIFDTNGFESKEDAETHLLQPNTEPMVLLEALSCLSLFKELTPVSYCTINYKNKSYANCSDTVVRNIINYITFDNNNVFNVSVIEDILGNKVCDSLYQFYEANPSPLKQNENSVHEAWGDVVSNLEFVEYKQAIDNSSLVNLKTTKGFIKLPKGIAPQCFTNEGFTVVDSNVECFEVRSTAHNLIVILNHILQLHLFNQESLAQEYCNKDINFVEKYLPKIFEKIGRVEFTANDNDNVNFSLYLNNTLINNLGHPHSKLDIKFKIRSHGTFEIDKVNQNINMDDIIKKLKQNASSSLLSNSLLFVLPVNKWFNAFPEINESFALPLWANFKEVDAVSKILNQNVLYKRRINMHEYNLLKKIINLHADQNIKDKYLGDLDFLWNLIKDFQNIKDEGNEEKIKQFVKDIFKLINNPLLLKNRSSNWILLYNFLFGIEIISKDEIFTEALNIATNTIINKKQRGKVLFKETLILASTQNQNIRNNTYTNAFNIAVNMINNYQNFMLLQALVEYFSFQDKDDMQIQVLNQALNSAINTINTNKNIGFNLLETLVEYSSPQNQEIRNEIFTNALNIAINAINTNNDKGFALLQTLIKYSSPQNQEIRNEIFTNALNIAINAINTNNDKGFALLQTLVECSSPQDQDDMQMRVFEQALNAVQNLAINNIQFAADLFKSIIYRISDQSNEKKIEVFNKALITANNLIIEKKQIYFHLFEVLLDKNFNNLTIVINQIVDLWIHIANNIEYLISNNKMKISNFFVQSFNKIFAINILDQNKKKEINLKARDVINKIQNYFSNNELLVLKDALGHYKQYNDL